jgi:hypothetical protein
MLTAIVIIVVIILAISWYRGTSARNTATSGAKYAWSSFFGRGEGFCGESCPGIKENVNGYCINR